MIKYKTKRFTKSVWITTKLTLSYPVFWIAAIILMCMAFSLLLSQYFYLEENEYLSSIFSNVFAGLITGLTLTLLSGTKSVYVTFLEGKLSWLFETHELILVHLTKKGELLHSGIKATDEEFFELAYDAGGTANHVNERVMQSMFDKVKWFEPGKYLKKKYNYDCMEMSKCLEDLKEIIQYNAEDESRRKMVIDAIFDKTKPIQTLNHDILRDIESLKIRIAASKKSII